MKGKKVIESNISTKKKPKWLRALETQSWQAELVISGLAIFGSLQLPSLLNNLVDYCLFNFSEEYMEVFFFLFIYPYFAATILIFSFIAHLILRALWIGMLGLVSVYPNGINPDQDFFSKDYMKKFLKEYPKVLKEFENLFARNRIFMERTIGGGAISAERALNYGFTGPNLRAAGVDYDIRVHQPYSSYQDFDFTIPVGKTGDNYDRFLVRNQEMWQSLSIIEQAYKKVQAFKGTDADIFHADVPEYYLPKKEDVYTKMESLIWHFKIVMGEVDMPKGEIYNAVEGGNGELGFYLVSDGGRTPFRLHFRRPCFIYYQAYPELITGGMLSDAIVTMSSLNLIAGELDA